MHSSALFFLFHQPIMRLFYFFFFQAEDGIRDVAVTGVQTCALPILEYEIVNQRAAPVTGQAVPSYGPQFAGEYFKKLECFCFTQQTLAPGETRRMPVTFVVDPKLPRDVNTITVSYTFFEVAGRGGKS